MPNVGAIRKASPAEILLQKLLCLIRYTAASDKDVCVGDVVAAVHAHKAPLILARCPII